MSDSSSSPLKYRYLLIMYVLHVALPTEGIHNPLKVELIVLGGRSSLTITSLIFIQPSHRDRIY